MTDADKIREQLACGRSNCSCRKPNANTHCPAHEDDTASLSVTERDGKVLVHCHAGCDGASVIAELNRLNLWPKARTSVVVSSRRIEAVYEYLDETGKLVFQSVRFCPKDFRQRQPDGHGAWNWNLSGVTFVPYQLPDLMMAVANGSTVFITEGEKDADNLRSLGLAATTNAGGAGKWRPVYNGYLRDAQVVILPDNDKSGTEHATSVAASLQGIARLIKILSLPGLPPKGDVSDWLATGGTADSLIRLADDAKEWSPGDRLDPNDSASYVQTVASRDTPQWPKPLDGAAYHGLAGDIVRTLEPHTESDPVALLIQFLVCFGNAIGRSAHFRAEADNHYANEYAVIVGDTSVGGKGTSWGQVRGLFDSLADNWAIERVKSGLSSGEGLIWAVRDPIVKTETNKKSGAVETIVVDGGIEDKRLLVVETEYASVLKNLGRDGNTLSSIMRDAWDRGDLSTLTKNSPARSTSAHVSVIGHITKGELCRYMSGTEAGNGFANRFLWLCVKRSKLLPEGGTLSERELVPLKFRLVEAIEYGKTAGRIDRNESARAVWCAVYEELRRPHSGIVGAILSRSAPHVMRLALLYAVLDQSGVITDSHVEAALSVWEYVVSSVKFIFGDSLGDPVADEILVKLRASGGLRRVDIRDLFNRNQTSARIEQALQSLAAEGLARCEMQSREPDERGRPTEWWFPA